MPADTRTAYQRGRILAAIAAEALTAQQLADRLHLTRDGINIHLKAMKEAAPRQVHVAGWVYNPQGGRPAPMYRPGDRPDAKYVAARAPTRHLQVGKQLAKIKRLLRAKPMTAAQLGQALGTSSGWARNLVVRLRAEKQVYIAGWQSPGAGIAPLYAMGARDDVPRPPIDPKNAYARLKHRRETDDHAREVYERDLRRRALNSKIKKLKAKPQGIFAALGV
jgi:predicted ArsR family transcriptional regulator